MRSILLAASAVTLIASIGTAQNGDQGTPQVKETVVSQVKTQENEAANAYFYKAFYLQNGAKKFAIAIELYKKFLGEAPKSKLAPIAARNTLNLLYRTNQIDQANEFRENHKDLLARAVRRENNTDRPGANRRGNRRGRQGGRVGRGNPRNAGAQLERLEKRLVALQKQIEEARSNDDMDKVEKLEGRLANLKKALKRIQEGGQRGDNPPGNRGRGRRAGGRRMMKPLTEMSKDELKQHVERLGSMIDRFYERMVERGMEDRAAKIKENFKKFKALIEAGKIEEAQKAMQSLFGRRRRRN